MGEEASRYRRILVKLSGEALMGEQPFGIEPRVVAGAPWGGPGSSPASPGSWSRRSRWASR